jgi:hypothetical protein
LQRNGLSSGEGLEIVPLQLSQRLWVVYDDDEEMSVDDLANDLIKLELGKNGDETVGSDCED